MIEKIKQFRTPIIAFFVALFLSGNLQEFYNADTQATPFAGSMLSGFPAIFMRFGKLQAAYTDASVGVIGLAFLITTYFLYKQLDTKIKESSYRFFNYAITFFFAVIITIGQAFAIDDSWSLYTSIGEGRFLFLIRLIGFSLLIYPIIRIIDRIVSDKKYLNIKTTNWKPSLMRLFLLIMAPKLLILAIFYPGNLDFNSQYSLMEYYSINASGVDRTAFNSGNPWFTVELIGRLNDLGRTFADGSFGIFLYGLLQTVIISFAFALIVKKLIDWKLPKWLIFGTLATFALSPMWLMIPARIVRDVTYAGIVAIWYYYFVDVINKRSLSLNRGILMLVLSVLLILFRSNAALLVLPGIVIVLGYVFSNYVQKVSKVALSAIILIPVILLTITAMSSNTFQSRVINRYPNIAIQQIARTFAYHSDEISPKIAEDMQPIIDVEKAPTVYNSNVGDSAFYEMKQSQFRENFGDKAGQVFWGDYLSLMNKYPSDFAQAFIGLNYLYYYPFQTKTAGEDPFTMFSIVDNPNNVWGYRQGLFDKLEYKYAAPLDLRMNIGNAMWLLNSMPPISFLTNSGLYGLAIVLLFFLAVAKKRMDLILAGAPLFLIFLMNLNAPVNGLTRYILPLLSTLPLYLGFMMYRLSDDNSQINPQKLATGTNEPIRVKIPNNAKKVANHEITNSETTSVRSRTDRFGDGK